MSSSPPAASLTNVDDKFLVATHAQAILLNRNTFQSKQKLEHCVAAVLQQRLDDVGDDIKQIAFIPAASVVVAAAAATASTTAAPVQLYAFFNDCTLYIWQDLNQQQSAAANPLHIDMRLTRIKYLRKFKAIPLDLEVVAAGAADVNSCLKTNEATIASVCFSSNRMFVAMTDGGLIVFARNTWKVQMLFTGTVGIKQCIFISHSIAGLLAIRTQHRDVIILDLNQPKNGIVVALPCRQVLTIQATLDGQIAFLLLQSGELVFYDLSFAVQIIAKKLKSLQRLVADDNQRNRERFGSIQSELAQTLPRARLVAILREFHEYPHKYRPLIWKTILRLPQSADEFGALIKRGRHSSTVNYRERYPLADASATRMLQRIVSCLSHWSPVFGQTQWIANFVFPFLKIFEHDAMVCFEVVATVLLNHGQHWFEFHPLPPINYLGMVENVLAHFEPTLVLHYTRIQVTTATYAWPLVQTAFTEMFDELQWMQLWDNILTEPPYFMLFCVVALNVLAKRQLELLNTADAVEQFFDETSSSLDVIAIVCKAKELMVSCPAMLHPKQYFGSCESLMMENDHQYKRFVNYPKQLNSCSSSEVVNGPTMIANETRRLNEKMFELEKLERELTDKRQHRSETVEHQRRMEQVQRMYDESILRERDRVAFQTKHLILCRRQLRARQMHLDLIADDDGDGDGERCVQMHENELDTLLLGLKRDVSIFFFMNFKLVQD